MLCRQYYSKEPVPVSMTRDDFRISVSGGEIVRLEKIADVHKFTRVNVKIIVHILRKNAKM